SIQVNIIRAPPSRHCRVRVRRRRCASGRWYYHSEERDSSSYDYSDDYHGAHSSAHLDREIKGYDSVIVSNFGFV
ncbi:hypothetical protein H9P43_004137, partial [Blastocladiella emersonii ATCC 22665]